MSRLVIDMVEPRRVQTLVLGLLGVVFVLAAWEVLARLGVGGSALLPPTEIVAAAQSESIVRAVSRSGFATLRAAGLGYLIGILIGTLMALVSQTADWAMSLMQRISVLGWVLPVVALTPVLMTFVHAATVPTIVATWFAYFYVFVGGASGLQEYNPSQAALIRSFGGTSLDVFFRVRVQSALPLYIDGLRLAAPAAITGAVFGEWFGAPRGLGVLLVSSMQNMQAGQMWVAAVLIVIIALVSGLVINVLQKLVSRRYS